MEKQHFSSASAAQIDLVWQEITPEKRGTLAEPIAISISMHGQGLLSPTADDHFTGGSKAEDTDEYTTVVRGIHLGGKMFKYQKIILKVIERYPDEFYRWVLNKREWRVVHDQNEDSAIKEERKLDRGWMKPYRVIVPSMNSTIVKAYGHFPECQESEKRLVDTLLENGRNL